MSVGLADGAYLGGFEINHDKAKKKGSSHLLHDTAVPILLLCPDRKELNTKAPFTTS